MTQSEITRRLDNEIAGGTSSKAWLLCCMGVPCSGAASGAASGVACGVVCGVACGAARGVACDTVLRLR